MGGWYSSTMVPWYVSWSVVQRRYERGTKPARNDVRKSRVSNWCHLVPRSSVLSIVIRTICPEKVFSPCSLHNRYDERARSSCLATVWQYLYGLGVDRGVNLNKFKSYVVIHCRAHVFWSFCMNKTGESGPCNILQICGNVSFFSLKRREKRGGSPPRRRRLCVFGLCVCVLQCQA